VFGRAGEWQRSPYPSRAPSVQRLLCFARTSRARCSWLAQPTESLDADAVMWQGRVGDHPPYADRMELRITASMWSCGGDGVAPCSFAGDDGGPLKTPDSSLSSVNRRLFQWLTAWRSRCGLDTKSALPRATEDSKHASFPGLLLTTDSLCVRIQSQVDDSACPSGGGFFGATMQPKPHISRRCFLLRRRVPGLASRSYRVSAG